MKNMGSIISSQNKQFCSPVTRIMDTTAGKKENYPLDNRSLTPNVIYRTQITNNTNDEHKKVSRCS